MTIETELVGDGLCRLVVSLNYHRSKGLFMRQSVRQKVLYSLLVPCLATLPTWGAQSEDPQPMFEYHSVGLYGWPTAEKDQRFFDALKIFRSRLMDLAVELDLEPFQGQAMVTGWDLLNSNTALRLEFTENGPSASMVFEPGSGSAESLYVQLTGFADMAELGLSELSPTSSEMMGPMGPIGFAHDDSMVWLSMGDGDVVSMDIPQGDLHDGVTPVMSGQIDIGTMIEMFAPQEFIEEIKDAAGMGMGMNPAMAFLSEDAPLIEFGVGVTDTEMHMASRLIGLGAIDGAAMTDEFSFEADVFERVPEDTVRLSAFQTNMGDMMGYIEMMMEEIGNDEYAQMSEEIGVDVIADIFGNFGERGMFYMSESTGGGGLLSSVVMLEIKDSDAFGEAHMTLIDKLNELAVEEIDGYVHVQAYEINGVPAFTFTVPGLPIPLEPSWAIADDTVIIALSPGSLEIAVAQNGGHMKSSILNNSAFQEAVIAKMPNGEAHTVSYYDAPRLAKKGYGMTSMFASAVANAARSPSNPDRVMGSLIPSYSNFTNGIAAGGMVSWWDGDDFCSYYTGDESILVQLSAGLGTVADVQGLVIPALAAGVLLPALGQAQISAKEVLSMANMRMLVIAFANYTADNQDQWPSSMTVLLEDGFLFEENLISPFGPAYDEAGDYVFRYDEASAENSFNHRLIIGIDRAMLLNTDGDVVVAFADFHAEKIDVDQLIEILELPVNEGAAEAFDIDWFLED